MNERGHDREERRFAELLGRAGIDTPAPDCRFLRELRKKSTEAFLAAATRGRKPQQGKRSPRALRRYVPASAAASVLAGLIALGAYLLAGGGGAAVAWADVQQTIEQAQTARFRMAITLGDGATRHWRISHKAPGHMRQENAHAVGIFDWTEGTILYLQPDEKLAATSTIAGMGNPWHRNWVGELKSITGSRDAKKIGTKQIDGREAFGWRIVTDEEPPWTVTVWADADSAELLEAQFASDGWRMVLTDFELNVELPEELFSLTPPQSYTHSKQDFQAKEASVEHVAVLLHAWAMGNGSVFPDALNSWTFPSAAEKADWRALARKYGADALSPAIHRAFAFLYMHSGWTYAGKGVELGDGETPVFWHVPGQEPGTAKVIYGDLKVKEVPADTLPQGSEADRQPSTRQGPHGQSAG